MPSRHVIEGSIEESYYEPTILFRVRSLARHGSLRGSVFIQLAEGTALGATEGSVVISTLNSATSIRKELFLRSLIPRHAAPLIQDLPTASPLPQVESILPATLLHIPEGVNHCPSLQMVHPACPEWFLPVPALAV